MKRLMHARAAYERAASTALAPDAPAAFRDATKDARAELALLNRRLPRFKVILTAGSGEAPGSRMLIDGQPLPARSIGTWVQAEPGIHEVRIDDSNGERTVSSFELREGEAKTVRVDEPGTSGQRGWAFASFGVGAAGLAVGISTGLVALDAHRDAERGCPDGRCASGTAGAEALERFETYRTISTVGYVVGAVGVGAGTVILLTSPEPSKPRVALTAAVNAIELEATF